MTRWELVIIGFNILGVGYIFMIYIIWTLISRIKKLETKLK
jgi:hypothetical protein